MNLNAALGILCAIAFLMPAVIILSSRLLINISLLALVVYFLIVATCTLMAEKVIIVDNELQRNLGVINNYLDVPLILTGMLMFCTQKAKKHFITTTIIVFIMYEVFILFQYKLSSLSSKYIMGPGILLVLGFSIYFFTSNIKNTIVQGKGVGKTLMITSILFAYGSYFIVYLFAYVQKTADKKDVFIIYYLTSIIFSALMSAGLIWVKKRLREIKEVQTTRRELNIFFNGHKHYTQKA
jgi:hypothetical protein